MCDRCNCGVSTVRRAHAHAYAARTFDWNEAAYAEDAPARAGRPTRAAPRIDFATARDVMYAILAIVNRTQIIHPDRWKVTAPWFAQWKFVLSEWHGLMHGTTTGNRITHLEGGALLAHIESVVSMTQPLLDVLNARGGREWEQRLAEKFYSCVAELERRAATTTPATPPPRRRKPFTFPERPKPVTLEDFFSVVSSQPSSPLEISRGYGAYSLGTATVGTTFSASNQDHRLLLWSNGWGVFFNRNGMIHAQLAKPFSEDIIMGAFIIGAQNARGSAFLAQLMVETALSFTPWGILADGVFALEALTRGDWKGAALTFLPGPAIAVASTTRAGRAAGRATSAVAAVTARLAKHAVVMLGRGVYRFAGKRLRGIWLVTDAGPRKYHFNFFDEGAQQWHDVPAAEATHYIKCSRCAFTPAARRDAVRGAVDEIVEDLAYSPVYARRGRVLVDRELMEDVVAAYGPWGDHVVELITDTWSSTGRQAVKLVDETLAIGKQLSHIKDAKGYIHAIDIFEDLASSSVNTARGTMFELQWAAKHANDIAALGIPVARKGWVGKGLDVLKKNGEAIELKHFDFTSEYYRRNPGRTVARIMKQVESRLGHPMVGSTATSARVSKVTVVFSSHSRMPKEFKRLLSDAMRELAKRKKADITMASWP